MFRKSARIAASLLAAAAFVSTPVAAEAQLRMPKLKVPKPPKIQLPTIPTVSTGADGSRPVPSDPRRGGAQGDMNAYMQDFMMLAQGVDQAADDATIEKQAEAYRQAVDRLASGRYNGVPAQMRQSNEMQAKQHFLQQASNVDGELEWATTRVSGNGGSNPRMPVLAYNQIFALDLQMDAAAKLFPGDSTFAAAKAKTDAWMANIGGRDNAGTAFEAKAIAEASKVQMPRATNTSASLKQMFRTAMGTSGINWEILAINPVGGWSDKFQNGRKIGQTHDAWIAARNPANPDHCNLYDFTMYRDLGGSVRRDSHSTKRIACENVK